MGPILSQGCLSIAHRSPLVSPHRGAARVVADSVSRSRVFHGFMGFRDRRGCQAALSRRKVDAGSGVALLIPPHAEADMVERYAPTEDTDDGPARKPSMEQATPTAEEARNDYYAHLLSRAASPAAHALIADVYARVEAWEGKRARKASKGAKAAKRGPYKRGAARAAAFRETLERFLGDLLRAQHDKRKTENASGLVFRPIGKKDFRPGDLVSYRNFTAAKDSLKGLQLINHALGKGRFITYFGKHQTPGKASRFEATPKLLKLAKDAGVKATAIDQHFRLEPPRRTLELRASSTRLYGKKSEGERIEFTPTSQTERLGADVKALNAFLSGFTLRGGVHYGFVRRFNEGDAPDFKWNKGGRLYSLTASSYQQRPSAERARMTINGEPVVEIDINASYLTAFHARLGEPLDLSSDPYARVGLPRNIVKAWTAGSFGNGRPLDRWLKQLTKDYEKRHKVKPRDVCAAARVRDAMLATYPALSRLGEPGVRWADLMFVESEALVGTMINLMKVYKVPSLSVHDSIIVPAAELRLGAGLLASHYLWRVGLFPRLSTKSTLPGVRETVEEVLQEKRRLMCTVEGTARVGADRPQRLRGATWAIVRIIFGRALGSVGNPRDTYEA
jgi:hypothetical protein